MTIPMEVIKVGGDQLAKCSASKIELHRMYFERGDYVMPIDVCDNGDGTYTINGNGRHRYYGAIMAGVQFIDVNVVNVRRGGE